jgi:hypothetical protein
MIKTLAISLLAIVAVSLPAHATAIEYSIDFTLSEFSVLLPTSGSFDYDPTVGFTNFIVNWDGQTFDLTTAANDLTLIADPPTGCGPTGSGYQPAYAFQILTGTAAGCDAHYAWAGTNSDFLGYDEFSFVLNPGGTSRSQDVIAQENPISSGPFYDVASGSWTVTEESSTSAPEPGTLGMMLFGGLAFAGTKLGTAARRRRH